jgi:hypothetical protein
MDIHFPVEELIKITVEAEEEKRNKYRKKRQWIRGAEDTIYTVIKDKLSGRSGSC